MGEHKARKPVREFSVDAVVLIADGVTETRVKLGIGSGFGGSDLLHSLKPEDVNFPEMMPVCLDFNTESVVGKAMIRREGTRIHANITLRADGRPVHRMWPSVGGIKHPNGTFDIKCLTLSTRPNTDPRIYPIKWPDFVELASGRPQ